MMPPQKLIAWLPWLIILATGTLYLFTLDTGLRPDELTGGDLITHQYAQVQARPSNAPGYPLYTMLGWLWFRLGRFTLGWILNPVQVLSAYSILWGLASLWVLYHILYRDEVTGKNWVVSSLLTLFYATTYFFWFYSVTTEQYTSAIFQTLLLIWLAFDWEENSTNQTLWLMAFVCGTMLANMLTTLFIFPPLLYLIFTKRPSILRNIKLIGQTTIIGLLPMLSYLYIFVRGAQHPEWRGQGEWSSTLDWFFQFISTQQGRDELAPGLTLQNLITAEFPALIWGELTWLVIIGGIIGLAMLGKRMRIFFFATLVIYLCFSAAYRFGNWFQVILPAYPMVVIGFGRLVGGIWQKSSKGSALQVLPLSQPVSSETDEVALPPLPARRPSGKREKSFETQRWPLPIMVIVLIALLTYRFTLSLPRANQRYLPTDTGLDPGWAILNDIETPNLTISASFEEHIALQYLVDIWRAKPAANLVQPGTKADYVTRRAVEADSNLVDLDLAHPQSIGANLIYLAPQAITTLPDSPNVIAVNHNFDDQIRLVGYRTANSGETITLYWTAISPLTINYTISVRLWQGGQPIQTVDGPLIQDHQPVWNTYPTTRWAPGEIIADAYSFALPSQTQLDQVQIIVYQQTDSGFENLGELQFTIYE